jgi:hypothetical protein
LRFARSVKETRTIRCGMRALSKVISTMNKDCMHLVL